ncbi:hypothetical protein [Robiginitalea sp. SC105]|uniref:hypothetical protein n=1 Tax=Robiginitalea sp. SC105 TaxID=2762332 RepID=UPI00163A674A|nr:hypothetical protein [Robiginitalea sp. SC105]MBC2838867.1 hypothetical protein [Robiginitalea sp. SC105]
MKKEKGLQKATDFSGIKTIDDLHQHLKTNPDDADELGEHFITKLNNAYAEKNKTESDYEDLLVALDEWEEKPEAASKIRNTTYEANYLIIGACIHNHIVNNICFPGVTAIQRETGLSRTTIYRHLKLDDFRPYDKLIRGKHELMAKRALEHLYYIGVVDRNAGALKTFIELTGFSKKSSASNINNYIQINNLKITREELDQLPKEITEQIAELISEGLQAKDCDKKMEDMTT